VVVLDGPSRVEVTLDSLEVRRWSPESDIAFSVHLELPADLTPGLYAATCFVPDAGDGKPHTVHGMKVEFEVK